MPQTNRFHFQASIEWLAEQEIQPSLGMSYPNDVTVNLESGCVVPFASLRVKCPRLIDGPCLHGRNFPCQGRGWVPESDVEKACWRIFEGHPEIVAEMMAQPELYGKYEVKEALLRAAKARMKERMVEAGKGLGSTIFDSSDSP